MGGGFYLSGRHSARARVAARPSFSKPLILIGYQAFEQLVCCDATLFGDAELQGQCIEIF
jgi:hypothetical protein